MVVGMVSRGMVPMLISFDENLVEMVCGALEEQLHLSASVYQMFGDYKEGDEGEF